jgi:hypothetical protein
MSLRRTDLKTVIALLTAATALAAAPLAAAEEAEPVVPPGNSAVNQYTETFPTAGGDKDVNKGRTGGKRSPGKVLGTRNAQRLEEHGPEGRAVAEVAAETAPSVPDRQPASDTGEDSEDAGAAAGRSGGGKGDGGGGNQNRKGASAGKPAPQRADGVHKPAPSPPSGAGEVDGSSGLGEILAQATGSTSSGEMGLLLPLIVLAAIAWSVAFVARRTQRDAR